MEHDKSRYHWQLHTCLTSPAQGGTTNTMCDGGKGGAVEFRSSHAVSVVRPWASTGEATQCDAAAKVDQVCWPDLWAAQQPCFLSDHLRQVPSACPHYPISRYLYSYTLQGSLLGCHWILISSYCSDPREEELGCRARVDAKQGGSLYGVASGVSRC